MSATLQADIAAVFGPRTPKRDVFIRRKQIELRQSGDGRSRITGTLSLRYT